MAPTTSKHNSPSGKKAPPPAAAGHINFQPQSLKRHVKPLEPNFTSPQMTTRQDRYCKWNVVGVRHGIIVGFAQHQIYEEEHPAYTQQVESAIRTHPDFASKLHVTCLKNRVDPHDRNQRRQFPRHNANGTVNTSGTPLAQTMYINILEDESRNTADYRAKWGRNLAQVCTAMTDRKFRFFRDRTPAEGPVGFLGDWLPTDEAMEVARMAHGGAATSEILRPHNSHIIHDIFGANREQEVHEYFNQALVPDQQQDAADPNNILEGLDLDELE